jgi:type VI secretion system secreted protein VgrG
MGMCNAYIYHVKQKYIRNGKSAGAPFRATAPQLKGTLKMKSKCLILSAFVALAGFLPQSKAQGILGSADSFAVLGGSTVTSTGNTILNGNLGVSPGTAITGFNPSGIVNGTIYNNDAVAGQAQADALSVYSILAGELFTTNLTGQDLGTLVLTPGVFFFSAVAQLTGILTLDAQGDSNARFDFQIGSTLTTASSSSILLINGAQADNVFWQVGSSATLGADTSFDGSILADQSITLNAGAGLDGRALALNAAVTLHDNVITVPTDVPEPGSFWLLTFCASVFGAGQRMAVWRRKAGRS